jgi:hypothetical protein
MLCARYPHASKYAFGGYTAGSGTAALLGAAFYTFTTSKLGMSYNATLSLVGLAPAIGLLAYAIVLPDPEGGATSSNVGEGKEGIVQLPWRDKLRIVKPMFIPYMLPLALIFFTENLVNQVVGASSPLLHASSSTDIESLGHPPDSNILSALSKQVGRLGWYFWPHLQSDTRILPLLRERSEPRDICVSNQLISSVSQPSLNSPHSLAASPSGSFVSPAAKLAQRKRTGP